MIPKNEKQVRIENFYVECFSISGFFYSPRKETLVFFEKRFPIMNHFYEKRKL